MQRPFCSRQNGVGSTRNLGFPDRHAVDVSIEILSLGSIDIGYGSGAEHFCLNKFEVHRPFKPRKKSEPLAYRHGMSQKPEFIDEICLNKILSEVSTAVCYQFFAGLFFKLSDPLS